jgi:hypothetical protein
VKVEKGGGRQANSFCPHAQPPPRSLRKQFPTVG